MVGSLLHFSLFNNVNGEYGLHADRGDHIRSPRGSESSPGVFYSRLLSYIGRNPGKGRVGHRPRSSHAPNEPPGALRPNGSKTRPLISISMAEHTPQRWPGGAYPARSSHPRKGALVRMGTKHACNLIGGKHATYQNRSQIPARIHVWQQQLLQVCEF